ncbi:MAG: IS66 family transposase [Rouxiella badensis]|uniref:IS66 family transposase n=1 Tax=Rouxiella badensis TaxID=1646377 RepID=UPI003C5A962C
MIETAPSTDDPRPEELPSDPQALRALVRELMARCEKLEHLLRVARNAQYGRSSEKLNSDQLELTLEDIEQAVAKIEAAEDKSSPAKSRERAAKRRANRGALPEHLPRIVETIAPESTVCPCCGEAMHEIGADESQRLDVVPAQFRVIVTRRLKFACGACPGSLVQAPAPERLIKGGLPTERLVAHVLAAKYQWHLPLYRQAQMMTTQGIVLDRSTLAFWVGYAAAELAPVYGQLKASLLSSAKIDVDETTAPVLDPGRGRTKTGYFWAIARDGRPWQGPEPPGVAYTYAPGRGAVHALKLLDNYTGIVQCDGYAAYKTLTNPERKNNCADSITLAFCWSHLRRRFVEIERTSPAPVAKEALVRIGQLYTIERALRGRTAEERRQGRQAHAKPLVTALKTWFEERLKTLSAKSPTAEAIRYGLNHWDGLIRFLDDGRIELDTNAVERAMRPIALNRKNALFAGCDEGAEAWACIASLIESCRLNGVDPEAYLADVLEKLVNGWPAARIGELLPWAQAYAKPAIAAEIKIAA